MTLTALELNILRTLRRSTEPLSGRQVADVVGVAPNTANRALKSLQGQQFVCSMKEGRATRWTTTADAAAVSVPSGSPQDRVLLVVTAVELEHVEVRNRLLNAERIRAGGVSMVRGEVPGERINWTVYLARAGMGNATSAALVGLAAGELHANLVAFVGTAAGLKPADQRHGDVVVANRIHNPYAGKQVSSESGSMLLGRDKTYTVPAPLVAAVNACITDSEWTSSPRAVSYKSNHPHAYVAPIVSVEAVQTDPNGPVMNEIRGRYQDAAALDMESFGLAAGSDIHDLPVLVVRGLSDFVGDKGDAGNDHLQPLAAGNAAALLCDILRFGHPDDFRRGAEPVSPLPSSPRGQQDADDIALPGGVQLWMDRLERQSPERAAAAREALSQIRRSGGTAASWLNRALHRPPTWLREDDTGDGWALVSALASIAGSKVAWRGFEQAAVAARLTGDHDAAAHFELTSRLERISNGADDEDDSKPLPDSLDGLDAEVLARIGNVIAFYRAVIEGNIVDAKARAEIALAAYGLSDDSGVLRSPEESVTAVNLDPTLRDVIAATMLRQLAQMMLAPGAADQLGIQSGLAARTLRGNPVTRDLADDGLRLAEWALALRPNSEGSRLTHAQTMLAVLVSMSGRTSADVDDEISRRARLVEADALEVRGVLRRWDGSTGSALAVAARARSLQGDFEGALRLVRPAPDGFASQRESRHPEVLRLGAFIARATGNDALALELAAKNPDRVEGELMRAAVLGSRPEMAREANEALFAALEQSTGSPHNGFQALMALARRFNSLTDGERATVRKQIDEVELLDRDLAEVMRARVLLSEGEPEAALGCVRGLELNELALEAQADALVATGRARDAAELVFGEGLRRGDIPLATLALQIATDNGLSDVTRRIALELLGRDDAKPARLKALGALRRVARIENSWHEVVKRTEQIIDELRSSGLPVPEVEHWQLAEALFFVQKFDKALGVLRDAPAVTFNHRQQAQLFLSILKRAFDEVRASNGPRTGSRAVDLGDPKLYSMFMRAAAEWAHDEQIAAAALSVALMAPSSTFTDAQVADIRQYSDEYFDRHGENASITQIPVGEDNLDALVEFMRSTDAHQRALEHLADEVRAGRFPLAVLTSAAGRTCTESLVRRDLGCVISVDDDGGLGVETARAAVGGRAVIDASALVVASWTGQPFKKLAARMDSIIVPEPVREDVLRARASLAMRSTSALGWDTRHQQPVLSEIPAEEADAYAAAVEDVWADLQGVQVAPVVDVPRQDQWLSAITVAQQLGVPLWADDVAMRRLARSMGVHAFGSLDLVRTFADEAGVAAAIASLRDNRVVDLFMDEPWHVLAAQTEWRLDSPFAIAISRPAAWQNITNGFAQFKSMMQRRPHDMDPERIASWAHLAGNGLALATVPTARPRVVSALLAWVISGTDPFFTARPARNRLVNGTEVPNGTGRVTEFVIRAAEDLRDRHYPAARALETLVDLLCRGLLDSIGPAATGRVMASLAEHLDDGTRSRFFAAYIEAVGK